MERPSRKIYPSSSNRKLQAIFASPNRYFTENSSWVPLPKRYDIFFKAQPVYLHRKGEGSLLLSEFECPPTILIKQQQQQQQQHIFFIKKSKKTLPSTWNPRPSTIRQTRLFCSKQNLRQPRNGVTDWSIDLFTRFLPIRRPY